MTQQFIITGNVEFAGEGILEGRVEAYDRDLPSLEKRGAAPQLLGQSPINEATLQFRIEFSDEQFRQGEGDTNLLRKGSKISPDLSFRVFDRTGQELTITRISAQNREYLAGQIIFNAPQNLSGVEIAVEPAPASADSEFEYTRLVNAIAPVIGAIPLADLTAEDVTFLLNELGLEQALDTNNQIEWLRRSALLARQTTLPIEAFYGWGRLNIPADLSELAGVPLADLTSVLNRLLALEEAVPAQTLQNAIAAKIIPDLGDRINEIKAQIERLKVAQGLLIARRFDGKLVNASNSEPLSGFRVAGFDLDAGDPPKPLGQTVSNDQGLFTLSYITLPIPADAGPAQMQRRLKLEIVINPQTQGKFELEIQAGGDAEIQEVKVTLPEPKTTRIEELPIFAPARNIAAARTTIEQVPFIDLDAAASTVLQPTPLLPFLKSKNINTIEDLQKATNIRQLEDLPTNVDSAQLDLIEAHTGLHNLTKDVEISTALIDQGFDNIAKIAKMSRPDFVNALGDHIGDFKAAELHVVAHSQTALLNNLMFREAADRANGLETSLSSAEQVRCSCQACEAAVSPLAYLVDLLKFATENIKRNDNPISIFELADSFHQRFDKLKASCEAVDTPVRQTRLCIEVLRNYLGTRPLADATKEATLAIAEKKYRLAAYTSLLTKFGTSFSEIRLARKSDPALRQSLADRLGIDFIHLKDLLLDPDERLNILTEPALEILFGLVDTNRDPLSGGVKLGDDQNQIKNWNLNNVQSGVNADSDSTVYVSLIKDPGNSLVVRVELYQDTSRSKLVAKGELLLNGTVKLLPENNSGLNGIFDITYVADSASISMVATRAFLDWQLQHMRTLWKSQDWSTDAYEDEQNAATLKQLSAVIVFAPPLDAISFDSDRQQLIRKVVNGSGVMTRDERQGLLALSADAEYQQAVKQLFQVSQRLPIIDPDLIGPDDFRRPKTGESDQVFDLWQKRSMWVSDRLKAFADLPKTPAGIPDIAQMFAKMSDPVSYGAVNVTAWENAVSITDFETLRSDLNQGINIFNLRFRLQDDFNLTVESFTQLMAIKDKAKAWEAEQREAKVSDEEWQEVFSILTQAQKVKLFATWRQEEKDADIQFGPESFWLSQTQPQEGNWPQTLPTEVPAINPSSLKLKDLPDLLVGERTIGLWNSRQQILVQIPINLEKELQNNGFDSMLKLSLGDPLPDLEAIKNELNNPDSAEGATQKITSLNLTIENFKRLLIIRAKVETTNKPTRGELAELYAILAIPYKIRRLYPAWKTEETTLSFAFWQVLKAKLPRWRATSENRLGWLKALLSRSQSPLIDPDLIGPDDLKNPVAEDSAFKRWKLREEAIVAQLTNLQGQSKDIAGLDTSFMSTLLISVDDFLKVVAAQAKGENIADRLVQLSLNFAEFNFLLRIVRLLQQNQIILDSEWENVDAILVQVWKRRQSARWRNEERKEDIFRSPDLFQIRPQTLNDSLTGEQSPKEIWRASRLGYQDWQDNLQTRIDQEQQTIQAHENAISTAEEEILEPLRDALILVANTPNTPDNLEAKAKWVTENLLIDAKTSGSITLTRVAQAIESLQTLFLALRTGRSDELFKNFKLSLETYDKARRVIGSYTSWRAAMFVFLYPENLLQPSLRKWQTPGFQTLVNDIKSDGNISINTIYKGLKTYVQYFQDVINMDIQATCVLRTRVSENYGESDSLNYRDLFYMFGINGGGSRDRIYWSAYDSKNGSSQAQTPWTLVQTANGGSIKNFGNISRIIGAITHQKLQGPSKEYMYLFAVIDSKNTIFNRIQSILYVKYDPDTRQWSDEATLIALPSGITSADEIVLCQTDSSNNYSLRFIIKQSRSDDLVNGLPIITSHTLDPSNNNWNSNNSVTIQYTYTGSYLNIRSARIVFELSYSALYIFIIGSEGDAIWKLDGSYDSPNSNVISYLDRLVFIGRPYEFLGSFTIYQLDKVNNGIPSYTKKLGVLLSLADQIGPSEFKRSLKLLLIDKDNFSNALSPLDGTGSILDRFYQNTSVDIGMAIQNGTEYSADNSYFTRIILSSQYQYEGFAIACIPEVTSDNKFDLKLDPSSAVPNDQLVGILSLVKPYIKRAYYNIFNNDYYILPPLGLTTENLQKRREFIQKVVDDNSKWGISSPQQYIKEAYYFAPLQIAIELQNKGEYLIALDIFRAFYDYTLDETSDQNARKIYYGFILEEILPLTYNRAQNWFLDPLNPLAIAETRQNCNLRFTLFAIIRCLLEFADDEFTQDTAESNARARSLYLTAQELLESKELKQGIAGCDEVVGFLDDLKPDDPRWQFRFLTLKNEVNSLPDLQTRKLVVPEIQSALSKTEPIEERFANARSILDRAKAELASTPTLPQLIEQADNTNTLMQRSLMGNSALQPALDTLRVTAQGNLLQAVARNSGATPEQLQDKDFKIPLLRSATPPPSAIAQMAANPISLVQPSTLLNGLSIAAKPPLPQSTDRQAFALADLTTRTLPGFIPQLVTAFCIPVNPLLRAIRLRTELSLKKLRSGLNIAGLKRQLEPYSAPTDTTSGLPTVGAGGQLVTSVATVNLQPTLYRYQVLIERAKQQVQLAAQIEAGLLGAEAGFLGAKAGVLQAITAVQLDEQKRVDNRFEKGFSLLKARQDLSLSQSGIQLQNLRLIEANDGVGLASKQKNRSQIQVNHYQNVISAGLSQLEDEYLNLIKEVTSLYNQAADKNFDAIFDPSETVSLSLGFPTGSVSYGKSYISTSAGFANIYSSQAAAKNADASRISALASYERRKQEWELQEALAQQDLVIGDQQITLATDRVGIVGQEKAIAELQTTNARDAVEYLASRITENPELTNTLKQTVEQFQLTAELYDYIKNVLEGVYRYFLQQATAIAKLAENQLAFERQEVPPTYIQSDYWSASPSNALNSNLNTTTPDRQGVTGSARLLQDVYQLDQYAFNTNKRKLQLTKTFSLALLAPAEFQRFRETGVILFSTPMELFDRDFPGHYLRLIRRVRTSVIALIPPNQGIHATLSTVGITRVVIGPEIFQTIPIRRDPEFVALTSPSNATGLFELESLQPDFLLPFEGNGVDSSWEFRMPKAANQFDFRTIADVLLTIEYTALNNFDYRQQVIQTLNPNLSGDRPFSFRNQFGDLWYDLNNPDQTKTPMKVKFQTFREDFPPNVETLKIQQVLLYFVLASQKTVELPITELRFTEQGNQGTVGGSATPIDGIISTRRGNAGSWTAMLGKIPVGEWELTLPNTEEIKKLFLDEAIDDILFVITYSGRTPAWPT
jgi:Tc toxin complex TcA C-terminal TcB-binding domain